jgi:hypothetical protein
MMLAMMLAMILLWLEYGEAPSYRRLIVAAVVTGLTGLVRPSAGDHCAGGHPADDRPVDHP